jgi:hypothetical protein
MDYIRHDWVEMESKPGAVDDRYCRYWDFNHNDYREKEKIDLDIGNTLRMILYDRILPSRKVSGENQIV